MIEQSFQRKELKSNKIRDRPSIGIFIIPNIYTSLLARLIYLPWNHRYVPSRG